MFKVLILILAKARLLQKDEISSQIFFRLLKCPQVLNTAVGWKQGKGDSPHLLGTKTLKPSFRRPTLVLHRPNTHLHPGCDMQVSVQYALL